MIFTTNGSRAPVNLRQRYTRRTSVHPSTHPKPHKTSCLPAFLPLSLCRLSTAGETQTNAPQKSITHNPSGCASLTLFCFKGTRADRWQHDTGRAAGRVVPCDWSHTCRPQGGRTARHIRDTATHLLHEQRKPPILHVLNGWCDSKQSLAAQSAKKIPHTLFHAAASFAAALSPPPPPLLPHLQRPPPPHPANCAILQTVPASVEKSDATAHLREALSLAPLSSIL
jgi:hypothetical protein